MRRILIAAIAIVAAGCSGSSAALSPRSLPPPPTSNSVTTAAYELHYTPTGRALPLVLVLGASGQDLPSIIATQGQNQLADRNQFAVAYIPAPNAEHLWYTGPNSSDTPIYDGVAYLTRQLSDIARRTPIDRSHVFIEGWSNGGFMAVHAITTAPETFAAAGEIESVLDLPVTTSEPVRVMHIHSVLDQVVPIRGGDSALLHAKFGRPVRLPSSYAEGQRLPIGSTWILVTDEGNGPGHHGYQPSSAKQFWDFFAETLPAG